MKQFLKNNWVKAVCFCTVFLMNGLLAVSVSAQEQTVYDAVPVHVDHSYSGRLEDECVDYYKFVLGESGKVTYTVSMNTSNGHLQLLNHEYERLDGKDIYHDSNRGCLYRKEEWYLLAGTYSFALQFDSANESFPESQTHPNDILSQAVSIKAESKYTGQIGLDDGQDFYMFHMPFSGQISMSHYSYGQIMEFSILDLEGRRLNRFRAGYDSNKGYAHSVDTCSLEKGDYYLKVAPWAGSSAFYNFKIHVKPNPCQIAQTKRNQSKAVVEIEKQPGVTGYILQYSTSSEFTKGLTKTKKSKSPNIKLTGLKKSKVYYVRAKTVKQWNGKIYYSEYGDSSTMY